MTFMLQERCCAKNKAHCVIGASSACRRERTYPPIKVPPPHLNVPELNEAFVVDPVQKRFGGESCWASEEDLVSANCLKDLQSRQDFVCTSLKALPKLAMSSLDFSFVA